jgi:hypothetical protein
VAGHPISSSAEANARENPEDLFYVEPPVSLFGHLQITGTLSDSHRHPHPPSKQGQSEAPNICFPNHTYCKAELQFSGIRRSRFRLLTSACLCLPFPVCFDFSVRGLAWGWQRENPAASTRSTYGHSTRSHVRCIS